MNKQNEIVIVICVFTFVICCFSVPIVIYATSSDTTPSLDIGIDIDVNNCPQQSNTTSLESLYSGNCSRYEGICSIYLKQLTPNSSILSTLVNTAILEEQLSEFFEILNGLPNSLISKECLTTVMPFLCQYAYPLCSNDGNAQFITQEQCVNMRDTVCVSEWRLAMTTDQGTLLPNCESFDASDNCTTIQINKTSAEPLRCHYQFQEFCGVCLPLCGKFSQYPDQITLGERTVIILAATLALIGGVIVFIAAVIRRKEMLVFPQVLTMYTTLSAMIIALFILISYIGGQERLYCSHETLHLSILEPSVFSQISGFALHFCFLFMAATWFLHLLHLFLGIVFPFWSRFLNERKWKIKLHISELFGSIILCGLAPSIFVSVSEYVLGRFPPLFALASKQVSFYTIILPLAIIFAAGVNLAFYSFLSIHKNDGIFRRGKGHFNINFTVPQIKILILLSYFVVFGIILLANFTVSINEADPFTEDLFRYFACQLHGYDPMCEDIRQQFEKHLKPGLSGATYLFIGLITWVHLLFAIQVQDVKNLVQRIIARYRSSVKVTLPHQTSSTSHKSSNNPIDA